MNNAIEFLKTQVGKDATNSPSPLMQWLNPILISVKEDNLIFEYEIRKEWLNPSGSLHGGITAAIVDDTIGATVFSFGEPSAYTTINNVVDYFSTAHEGQTIIAETQTIKKGKKIINVQCEIWNNSKARLIAKGYSNLLRIEKQI
ncbi:PaaI family thioesterase [Aquimarina agarilytica]|uniref:PaaI family thioesterase n=1 Tax=Aquimarina agarilytica TaxID=1087449 RepID=UPI00028986C3|nr:PaaI family thioesterase [Aquimarina agarilytica]